MCVCVCVRACVEQAGSLFVSVKINALRNFLEQLKLYPVTTLDIFNLAGEDTILLTLTIKKDE